MAVMVPVATSSGLLQPAQSVTTTITTSSVTIAILQTTSNMFSSSYVVPAKRSGDCGSFNYYVFNASAGPIAGTITSNNTQLNFKVASISDFKTWALQPDGSYVGRNCIGPEHPILTRDAVTTYSFSANLPRDGEYVMTFINTPGDEVASVRVTMNYLATYMYMTTSYALETQTNSRGNPPTNIPGFPLESILAGLLLAIAVLVLMRSKMARRRSP
jgi:hypothetical protein